MSSKHDKKKHKHQQSAGTGLGAVLDVFSGVTSSSSSSSMAAKAADWEQKGDAGVVGDDVSP